MRTHRSDQANLLECASQHVIVSSNFATMKVWIAAWEVEGTERGVEIFAERNLAVEAAIGYAQELSLLEDEGLSIEQARRRLRGTGELNFYDRQCCYSDCEHEVIGLGQ